MQSPVGTSSVAHPCLVRPNTDAEAIYFKPYGVDSNSYHILSFATTSERDCEEEGGEPSSRLAHALRKESTVQQGMRRITIHVGSVTYKTNAPTMDRWFSRPSFTEVRAPRKVAKQKRHKSLIFNISRVGYTKYESALV